jgi:hypothetical protein
VRHAGGLGAAMAMLLAAAANIDRLNGLRKPLSDLEPDRFTPTPQYRPDPGITQRRRERKRRRQDRHRGRKGVRR